MIRKFDLLTKLDATDPMPMTLGPLVCDESARAPTAAVRNAIDGSTWPRMAPEQWKRVSPVHRNEVFGDEVRRLRNEVFGDKVRRMLPAPPPAPLSVGDLVEVKSPGGGDFVSTVVAVTGEGVLLANGGLVSSLLVRRYTPES